MEICPIRKEKNTSVRDKNWAKNARWRLEGQVSRSNRAITEDEEHPVTVSPTEFRANLHGCEGKRWPGDDSRADCIIRHARYAGIGGAPWRFVRTTITRKLPLIKIASTEAVVARERVSPVFVRYPAERLLNERLMLGPSSVSTTNFGGSARCAPPNFSSNRNVCSFKNIAGDTSMRNLYSNN